MQNSNFFENTNSIDKSVTCALKEDDNSSLLIEKDDESHKDANKSDISLEIDAELGINENHFSRPEGYFCVSTIEELEMAIESCKEIILAANEGIDRKKKFVAKLVELRLKLEEIREGSEEHPDFKAVLGHNFQLRSLERPQQYCEKCCSIIWGVINNWYRCTECGFKCHSKCLNLITRVCAITKVASIGSYELSICPEVGLSQQKFRCAECKRKFVFKDKKCLPRLCDYNGFSYCSFCHWNSLSVVPARVVHDWDFKPRKICRASLQYLRLMLPKPILNLESLNPSLFALVTELSTIKKLRQDLLKMKAYFLTCHAALEEKLLLRLKDRQHFVENADNYSLQDLIDVNSGALQVYLEEIHSAFVTHITKQCQGCHGKGFICELCKSEDVIFPFEPRTEACASCHSVFHQECYLRWNAPCPRCTRKAKFTYEGARD